jgi:hypothetical protein
MSQAPQPTTNLRRRKPATKAVVVKSHRRQAPKKALVTSPTPPPLPPLSVEDAIALRDHMRATSPLRIAREQRRLRWRAIAARVFGWAIFVGVAFVVISHALAR